MAGAALPGRLRERLAWRVARLAEVRDETPTARTLVLDVPGWPGHLSGQRVDVRLTAADGYSTRRSYSLAAPAAGDRVELTVQRVPGGEVSPYLTEIFSVGDPVEIRGPIGGWFVWRPADPEPVLLVAGGSGIVPLMAMVRARRSAASRVPFRLICSVRSPADLYYADELREAARADPGLDVTRCYTRVVPDHWTSPPRRLRPADLAEAGWPPDFTPTCYVCGPTGFVEAVADALVEIGHEPERIRTERFGPSGSSHPAGTV
ncbi:MULTISPECIES: FAD-binding oxidoreductase [unclassified Parafrankia]|uniref:FAD-binding oxidoreductase n=1 Tax=Parafrankia TaxID=2994362 RepID=UPI000DA511A1|nr:MULTISPECIES: FAD-binding oxidoreductase [unclassified Parafrankia]TCJ34351.1 oxidoreductase [Parafrankia sp. BMG5.11]SQD95718.1 Oxidoreductase FAD-binding domain protein [Parafrankia sp. Ea1.12]